MNVIIIDRPRPHRGRGHRGEQGEAGDLRVLREGHRDAAGLFVVPVLLPVSVVHGGRQPLAVGLVGGREGVDGHVREEPLPGDLRAAGVLAGAVHSDRGDRDHDRHPEGLDQAAHGDAGEDLVVDNGLL